MVKGRLGPYPAKQVHQHPDSKGSGEQQAHSGSTAISTAIFTRTWVGLNNHVIRSAQILEIVVVVPMFEAR